MVQIAVVGMGWAGSRHVDAIRELNGKLQVHCLVDSDADHLRGMASELGVAKTYTSYAQMLSDAEVEAVSICTPHPLHCPMAIQAAEAGKHILVEKPMAVTVADATRMLDAAGANRVKLYVAENASYTPMTQFLQRVVQSGELIGALAAASISGGFRAPDFGYPGRRAWLTNPDQGGSGTWMLHGIHTVAQLRTIFGEVSTVYMQENKLGSFRRPDLEGTMSGLLTLACGVSIFILQTCESHVADGVGGYMLHGERGSIHATAAGYRHITPENRDDVLLQLYPPAPLSDYALEMAAFTDYVCTETAGPTTGLSERRSLAIVQAGYESAQSGRAINLRNRFGPL